MPLHRIISVMTCIALSTAILLIASSPLLSLPAQVAAFVPTYSSNSAVIQHARQVACQRQSQLQLQLHQGHGSGCHCHSCSQRQSSLTVTFGRDHRSSAVRGLSMSMMTSLDTTEKAALLKASLKHPAGKLTLVTELDIQPPSDILAFAAHNADVVTLSKQMREAAKANVLVVTGNLGVLGQMTKEQETARGKFPGPLPVIFWPSAGEEGGEDRDGLDLKDVAAAGAVGVVIDWVSTEGSSSVLKAKIAAAKEAGLVPLLYVSVGMEGEGGEGGGAALPEAAQMVSIIEQAAASVGEGREAGIVIFEGPPVELPPELTKSVVVVAAVSLPAGGGRIGTAYAGYASTKFASLLLRTACVPKKVLAEGPKGLSTMWTAICRDLKSTRSKNVASFSFKQETRDEWIELYKKMDRDGLIEAMADNTGTAQVAENVNTATGDYVGF